MAKEKLRNCTTFPQLLAVTGRDRRCLLNPDHLHVLLAGPVSHTGMKYIDFVEILNVSLDFSPIDFARFSRC